MIKSLVLRVVSSLVSLLVVALVLPVVATTVIARSRTVTVADAEHRDVAIVLGAATNADGTPTQYLAGRLDVARDLFLAGKVDVIVVSGHVSNDGYDEPEVMENYLVKSGVPRSRVVRDTLGDDTFSTCWRARNVYGVTEAYVVTQNYHLPRTISSCLATGISTAGVPDATQKKLSWTWLFGALREAPATTKMVIDVVTRRTVSGAGDRNAVVNALAQPR